MTRQTEITAVVVTLVLVFGMAIFLDSNRNTILSNAPSAFATAGATSPDPVFACPSSTSMYITGSGSALRNLGTFTISTKTNDIPSVTPANCQAITAQATATIDEAKSEAQLKAKNDCERQRPAFYCQPTCSGGIKSTSCTAGAATTSIIPSHVTTNYFSSGSQQGNYVHTFKCNLTATAPAQGAALAVCSLSSITTPTGFIPGQ